MSRHSWYPVWVLTVLVLAYLLAFVDRQLLYLLVGPIREDLDIGDFQFSLISGWAFALFYTLMGIPIGRLADIGNRRNIIAVGVALWSLMTALCGLAKNFTLLFLARVGVGVGEAALSPPAYSLLSDYFTARQLPRAMAVFTLGISMGGGVAYLIGGAVVGWVSELSSVSLPLVGSLRPWQLAFVVIGICGLPMALLVLTIAEPVRLFGGHSNQTQQTEPFFSLLKTTWQTRQDYAAILFVVPLLSVVGYAFLSWYPEFLIRSFSMPRSQAGYIVGWLYLIAGSSGTLGGAWLAGFMARCGYLDANVRLIAVVATLLPIPAVLTVQLSLPWLSIFFGGITILLLSSYFGVALAALQLITPNRSRASLSALLLLANNLLGLGIGTSLVAALTEFGFGYDRALGHSIAIVAAVFSTVAAYTAWRSLNGYRTALAGFDAR